MNAYRREVSEGLRDARWTFFKGIPLFLMVVVFLAFVGFWMNSLGLFGRTIVERKVFENSFQYSEATKSQIAMDEAVLAEIEGKLLNPNLDENTKFNLKAQASAARVRIATARRKQQ